jgi:hypothetical protein
MEWEYQNMGTNIRRLRVIGQFQNVNFAAFPVFLQVFFCHVFLCHVKNTTSFHDLKTVANVVYSTYKKECLVHGLEFDDKQWFDVLEESALSKMPSVMQILFRQILVFGNPADPKVLWERLKLLTTF